VISVSVHNPVAGLPSRRIPVKPGLCFVELPGQLQQGELVSTGCDKLHPHRQTVRAPVQRQADGRLPGGILQVREAPEAH